MFTYVTRDCKRRQMSAAREAELCLTAPNWPNVTNCDRETCRPSSAAFFQPHLERPANQKRLSREREAKQQEQEQFWPLQPSGRRCRPRFGAQISEREAQMESEPAESRSACGHSSWLTKIRREETLAAERKRKNEANSIERPPECLARHQSHSSARRRPEILAKSTLLQAMPLINNLNNSNQLIPNSNKLQTNLTILTLVCLLIRFAHFPPSTPSIMLVEAINNNNNNNTTSSKELHNDDINNNQPFKGISEFIIGKNITTSNVNNLAGQRKEGELNRSVRPTQKVLLPDGEFSNNSAANNFAQLESTGAEEEGEDMSAKTSETIEFGSNLSHISEGEKNSSVQLEEIGQGGRDKLAEVSFSSSEPSSSSARLSLAVHLTGRGGADNGANLSRLDSGSRKVELDEDEEVEAGEEEEEEEEEEEGEEEEEERQQLDEFDAFAGQNQSDKFKSETDKFRRENGLEFEVNASSNSNLDSNLNSNANTIAIATANLNPNERKGESESGNDNDTDHDHADDNDDDDDYNDYGAYIIYDTSQSNTIEEQPNWNLATTGSNSLIISDSNNDDDRHHLVPHHRHRHHHDDQSRNDNNNNNKSSNNNNSTFQVIFFAAIPPYKRSKRLMKASARPSKQSEPSLSNWRPNWAGRVKFVESGLKAKTSQLSALSPSSAGQVSPVAVSEQVKVAREEEGEGGGASLKEQVEVGRRQRAIVSSARPSSPSPAANNKSVHYLASSLSPALSSSLFSFSSLSSPNLNSLRFEEEPNWSEQRLAKAESKESSEGEIKRPLASSWPSKNRRRANASLAAPTREARQYSPMGANLSGSGDQLELDDIKWLERMNERSQEEEGEEIGAVLPSRSDIGGQFADGSSSFSFSSSFSSSKSSKSSKSSPSEENANASRKLESLAQTHLQSDKEGNSGGALDELNQNENPNQAAPSLVQNQLQVIAAANYKKAIWLSNGSLSPELASLADKFETRGDLFDPLNSNSSNNNNNNNNTSNHFDLEMRAKGQEEGGKETHNVYYWRLIWFILPLGATFGNLLVIIAVYKERSLQSVTNYFIVSLAFADLFVGIIVMPFAVYVLVNEVWGLSDFICDIYVAVDVTSSTASILNLVAISIDRYRAVAHPIAYSARSSSRRAMQIIFLVWLISCCVGAPIILGLNTSQERKSSLCILYNSTFIFWSSLTSFYVPCIMMIGLYWRIFIAIRSRTKKAIQAGANHRVPSNNQQPQQLPAVQQPQKSISSLQAPQTLLAALPMIGNQKQQQQQQLEDINNNNNNNKPNSLSASDSTKSIQNIPATNSRCSSLRSRPGKQFGPPEREMILDATAAAAASAAALAAATVAPSAGKAAKAAHWGQSWRDQVHQSISSCELTCWPREPLEREVDWLLGKLLTRPMGDSHRSLSEALQQVCSEDKHKSALQGEGKSDGSEGTGRGEGEGEGEGDTLARLALVSVGKCIGKCQPGPNSANGLDCQVRFISKILGEFDAGHSAASLPLLIENNDTRYNSATCSLLPLINQLAGDDNLSGEHYETPSQDNQPGQVQGNGLRSSERIRQIDGARSAEILIVEELADTKWRPGEVGARQVNILLQCFTRFKVEPERPLKMEPISEQSKEMIEERLSSLERSILSHLGDSCELVLSAKCSIKPSAARPIKEASKVTSTSCFSNCVCCSQTFAHHLPEESTAHSIKSICLIESNPQPSKSGISEEDNPLTRLTILKRTSGGQFSLLEFAALIPKSNIETNPFARQLIWRSNNLEQLNGESKEQSVERSATSERPPGEAQGLSCRLIGAIKTNSPPNDVRRLCSNCRSSCLLSSAIRLVDKEPLARPVQLEAITEVPSGKMIRDKQEEEELYCANLSRLLKEEHRQKGGMDLERGSSTESSGSDQEEEEEEESGSSSTGSLDESLSGDDSLTGYECCRGANGPATYSSRRSSQSCCQLASPNCATCERFLLSAAAASSGSEPGCAAGGSPTNLSQLTPSECNHLKRHSHNSPLKHHCNCCSLSMAELKCRQPAPTKHQLASQQQHQHTCSSRSHSLASSNNVSANQRSNSLVCNSHQTTKTLVQDHQVRSANNQSASNNQQAQLSMLQTATAKIKRRSIRLGQLIRGGATGRKSGGEQLASESANGQLARRQTGLPRGRRQVKLLGEEMAGSGGEGLEDDEEEEDEEEEEEEDEEEEPIDYSSSLAACVTVSNPKSSSELVSGEIGRVIASGSSNSFKHHHQTAPVLETGSAKLVPADNRPAAADRSPIGCANKEQTAAGQGSNEQTLAGAASTNIDQKSNLVRSQVANQPANCQASKDGLLNEDNDSSAIVQHRTNVTIDGTSQRQVSRQSPNLVTSVFNLLHSQQNHSKDCKKSGQSSSNRPDEIVGQVSRHRTGSKRRRERNAARRERKATKTLAIVLGIFLICWTPFFTCNIIDGVCIQLNMDCRPGMMVYLVTSWLGYINSCVNPIIYTIFNMEFRRAFKKILTTHPGCCKS